MVIGFCAAVHAGFGFHYGHTLQRGIGLTRRTAGGVAALIVAVGGSYIEREDEVFQKACLYIGTRRQLAVTGVDDDTFLTHIAGGDTISGVLAVAGHGELVVMHRRQTEHLFLPVNVHQIFLELRQYISFQIIDIQPFAAISPAGIIHGFVVMPACILKPRGVIIGYLCAQRTVFSHVLRVVVTCTVGYPLLRRHHIYSPLHLLQTPVGRQLYLQFLSFGSGLGGDQHYAVSTSRTVDSTTGRVLEHVNPFYIAGVQSAQILYRHTIYHIQRCRVGIDTGTTADHYLHTTARSTVRSAYLHTGKRTLQYLCDVVRHAYAVLQVICLDTGERTRYAGSLGGTVSYDHGLVQRNHIRLEVNNILRPFVQSDNLGLITYVTHLQLLRPLRHGEGETALQVRDSTDSRTRNLYRCSDGAFSAIVEHTAVHYAVGCHNR